MGNKKETDFLVCPECGGTDLRWLLEGAYGEQYKCMKCGYKGFALRGSAKFAKELEKKKNEE